MTESERAQLEYPSDDAPTGSEVAVRKVKSAVRTVELLEYLAARQDRPARIREISAALDMPRSSAHALLRTLMTQGWVRSDDSGTLYGIGIRALLVGTSYLDSDPYLPLITPFLDDLRRDFDETFHVGRLDGTDVVYLATRESRQYQRTTNRVGRRLPAHATALGKALLAERFGAELARHVPDRLQALTPRTIVDGTELTEALEIDEELGQFDHALARALRATTSDNTYQFFSIATHLADTLVLTLLCIAVAVGLLWRKHWLYAASWLIAIIGNALLTKALKALFQRLRPLHDHGFAAAEGWSFPSGHASGALVVYSMLAYLAICNTERRWHLLIVLLAIAVILLVGSSRIFLQVHYFSDVLAGFCSGATWLIVCVVVTEIVQRQRSVIHPPRS